MSIPLRKDFKTLEEWADALCLYLSDQSVDTDAAAKKNPPIGTQVVWPNATYFPDGWLDTDGAAYATSRYPQLARVLGAAGATFNVPNVAGSMIRAE